ncbi:BRCT domain-containing protein [Aeromonas hydrophila]|uniref:BRCT domain-containing protein n=1 Tax=Aeromonas hydrophila TaxID=644 RepID=UPI002441BCA5|nr:BRCT domain-containing protein [Aeromonas hydrophila]
MSGLDRHGQPLANYNAARNRDKQLNNLMGILDGIVADSAIDEQEMLYLDIWLKESASLNGWIFRELREMVADVLQDGQLCEAEKLHLMSALPRLMETYRHLPGVDFYSEASDKLLLEGLCQGLMGDQTLSDDEIHYLNWWMKQNSMLRAHYPGKQLYQTVERILQDGVITEEEREELQQQLLLFVGNPFEQGVVTGMASKLAISDTEIDTLHGCSVCFTGMFLSGTRRQCEETALLLGATPQDAVTQKLDYLIIGELSSRDWRFSSYGRKIEKAMLLQEKGHSVRIVTEEAWLTHANTLHESA